MRTLSRNYLRTAARRAGVTDLWLDDAIQDISIRLWLADPAVPQITVVRRAAIDAVRRYCGDRRKARKPEMVSIEAARDQRYGSDLWADDGAGTNEYTEPHVPIDPYACIDDFDEVRRKLDRLTPCQRAALALEVSGRRPSPEKRVTHWRHLSDARARLRVA